MRGLGRLSSLFLKASPTLFFILSSHMENSSHVESHFFNFTPVLLSILSLFLLFYLNFFFSLSSFLASLLNPPATPQPHPQLNHTHGSTTTPRQDRKPPHLAQIGNPTTTPTAPPLRRDKIANHHTQPRSATPQGHNHTHSSITPTAPPLRRDKIVNHHTQPRSAIPQPHPRLNHTHGSITTPRQDRKHHT